MRRSWRLPLLLLCTLLPMGFNSCQEVRPGGSTAQNTVAGNPKPTSELASSICQVIHRCHPEVGVAACEAGVAAVPGFDAPLGLPAKFKTLSAVGAGEAGGVLAADAAAVNSCRSAIEARACDAPEVRAAYDKLSADPYAGSVQMVAQSDCGRAVIPVSKYACDRKIFLRGKPARLAPLTAAGSASYSIAPALPAGLALDPASGAISGNPSALSPLTTYTVTANVEGRSVSNQIQLRSADGYLVDDLGDAPNTAGSVCATAGGTCTLRAALAAAAAPAGSRVIVAPAGNIGVNSALSVRKGVEIYGDCEDGTVVDGQGRSRVFSISDGPTTLDHLTVQNGRVTGGAGAGIEIDAGPAPYTVTLHKVVVRDNTIASAADGMSDGAGIQVFAADGAGKVTVDISDCVVENNLSDHAAYGGGLGLWFNTHAEIRRCTFRGNRNTDNYGGGISTRSGSLNISDSVFIDNSAPAGEGGAVFIGHQAAAVPGFTNVTFHNNVANDGGAVYVGSSGASVLNATFVGNRSLGSFYGGALATLVRVSVRNSIFAANLSAGVLKHCDGGNLVQSAGNNLSDAAAADCGLRGPGDLTARPAMLGPLQANGGSTLTIAPLPGSPAEGNAAASACPAADQRGVARLADGRCDIGAFER